MPLAMNPYGKTPKKKVDPAANSRPWKNAKPDKALLEYVRQAQEKNKGLNPNSYNLGMAAVGMLPKLPPDPYKGRNPFYDADVMDRAYHPIPWDLAGNMMNPKYAQGAEEELMAYPPYRRSRGLVGYPPR